MFKGRSFMNKGKLPQPKSLICLPWMLLRKQQIRVAPNGGQRKLASDKSSHKAWSVEDTKKFKRKFSELLAA